MELLHLNLYEAVRYRHISRVQLLLMLGADLTSSTAVAHFGRTCLQESLNNGRRRVNLELVKILIDAGPDFAERDILGNTCLHYAARTDHTGEIVGWLLEAGADDAINIQNVVGNTALHCALEQRPCEGGAEHRCAAYSNGYRRKVARKLLDAGADALLPNQRGETCLHVLFDYYDDDVAMTLFHYVGSLQNVELRDAEGYTPMWHAVMDNRRRAAELLLRKGVAIDDCLMTESDLVPGPRYAMDEYFHAEGTALHMAGALGSEELVGLLLENGADANAVNQNGLTVVQLAAGSRLAEGDTSRIYNILCRLQRAGGSLVACGDDRFPPPFQCALQYGRLDAVIFFMKLVNAGKIESIDEPFLHVAVNNIAASSEIVKYLIVNGYCTDIDKEDADGITPLLKLTKVWESYWDPMFYELNVTMTADVLLKFGANMYFRDAEGLTVIQLACQVGNTAVQRAAVKHMALNSVKRGLDNVIAEEFARLGLGGEFIEFYDRCCDELRRMEDDRVPNSVTYFHLLSEKYSSAVAKCTVVARYLGERRRRRMLRRTYPTYSHLLYTTYRYEKRRHKLISKAKPKMYGMINFLPAVPAVCSRIFDYLGNETIKKIIKIPE